MNRMTGTKRMMRIAGAVLGLSLVAAGDASAQWNVARFATAPNRVYTSVGVDPALVGTMGYGRVVRVKGHDWQLSGDAALAAGHRDLHDFRARLGTGTSLLRWRSVHLAGSATFITRGTENAIYRGLNFGADLTGTLGVYRPRWFAGGEFGKDKAIVTHITHSDWYREHYYAGAKDGWYLDAGGTLHFGFTGGFAIGRTELAARFGVLRTERFDDMMPPMYASLGVGREF